MTTNEILDRVKAEYGLTSDYQLAKKLGVSGSRISNYRAGISNIDDSLILSIENLLDVPPGSLLLEMHAERSKCAAAAKILHQISAKMLSTAAAIILGISVVYSAAMSPEVNASPAAESGNTVYYVK